MVPDWITQLLSSFFSCDSFPPEVTHLSPSTSGRLARLDRDVQHSSGTLCYPCVSLNFVANFFLNYVCYTCSDSLSRKWSIPPTPEIIPGIPPEISPDVPPPPGPEAVVWRGGLQRTRTGRPPMGSASQFLKQPPPPPHADAGIQWSAHPRPLRSDCS